MDIKQDLFFAEQIFATLFSLTNKVQMQGDKHLGDLSVRQMMLMTAIIHLPDGKATLNNIARKLGCSKQSVKQMVTIMDKKGYLVTMPNELDKRAVNVTITLTGKQVVTICSERTYDFLAGLFDEFTTEEMETMWVLLKKLYRFDGMEQDGFEQQMNYTDDLHEHTLSIFEKRRMHAQVVKNETKNK